MKKIFISILLLSFFINNSFAYKNLKCNTDYLRKLELCNQAIKTGNYKSLDFICIQKNLDMQLFQIILDDHFKKIDLQAKRSLDFLDKNKDYYFSLKENSPSFLDGINDIENDFGIYGKYYDLYRKACFDEINYDFASCIDELAKKNKKNDMAVNTLANSWGDICFGLAKTKLSIYKQTAYEILILDKLFLRKDNRTGFMQSIRKSYSALARLFDININLIEKIYFKWPMKIKEAKAP